MVLNPLSDSFKLGVEAMNINGPIRLLLLHVTNSLSRSEAFKPHCFRQKSFYPQRLVLLYLYSIICKLFKY